MLIVFFVPNYNININIKEFIRIKSIFLCVYTMVFTLDQVTMI